MGDMARSSTHNSHNSWHPAAICDEKVAKGFHDVPRDGPQSHRQAAVFSIVSATQSRGWDRGKQVTGQRGCEEGPVAKAALNTLECVCGRGQLDLTLSWCTLVWPHRLLNILQHF